MTKELKIKFAKLLFEYPEDPFKAASEIYSDENEIGLALQIATEWPKDEEVIKHLDKLAHEGFPEDKLASKSDLANSIWLKMNECYDVDAYVKLANLYAEVRGFKTKPQTNINTNVQQNKVIVIRESVSDDAWEEKLVRQQDQLINDSADFT